VLRRIYEESPSIAFSPLGSSRNAKLHPRRVLAVRFHQAASAIVSAVSLGRNITRGYSASTWHREINVRGYRCSRILHAASATIRHSRLCNGKSGDHPPPAQIVARVTRNGSGALIVELQGRLIGRPRAGRKRERELRIYYETICTPDTICRRIIHGFTYRPL